MYQLDFDVAHLPEDIYFFSSQGRHVIAGDHSYLHMMTRIRSLRFTIMLFVFVGLPIAVLVMVLTQLIGQFDPITPLVIVGLACVYMGFTGYIQARRLHSKGRITIGHVTGYSETIAFHSRGYRRGIKVTYRFRTHDGEEVEDSRLIRLKSNERENPLPAENTPVAVLYLNSNWHTLL